MGMPTDANTLFDWFWRGAAGLGGSLALAKIGWSMLRKLTNLTNLSATESGTREDVIITLNRQVESLYKQLGDLDMKLKSLQKQSDDDAKKRRELEKAIFEKDLRITRLENQVKTLGKEPVA